MSAPLNDVALAAFGTAAIFAWTRLHERPSFAAAAIAGLLAGLAIGVKYPALVLLRAADALLMALRSLVRPCEQGSRGRGRSWLALAAVYLAATVLVGGWWYLRAYVHTGNPVYPFFRHVFGGAGLDEVLDPIKRPMAVTRLEPALSLVPLSLQPDRFDSFSHQFGPIFLLFLPAVLLERPPRRVLGLVALGYLFLMLCMTQRQSMRFLLIALGPMSVAVAYLASVWCERKTVPARLLMALLLVALGLEASLAVAGPGTCSAWSGRESAEFPGAARADLRRRAMGRPEPARDGALIGQDHRGFYIPRDYTMELAHRRRTGLGRHGEVAGRDRRRLCESGFTHVMLCPPVPETAVEFDPTLGRLLAPWLAGRTPLYREDLTDGDGVVRRYSIYELSDDRLASRPTGGPPR